jgi:two-component system sensor histidine kinase/response regulator
MPDTQKVVLVVDDTPDNVALLEAFLSDNDYSVVTAGSGKECLEKAGTEHPNMIILDIRMPEMDGYETLTRLKAAPQTKQIPVILLTAERRDPGDIEKGFQRGAEEYLTKPINMEELLVRVKAILQSKEAEQQLERYKADFTSMLVHDLRGPLGAVKGLVEYAIGEGNLLPEQHEVLNLAIDASNKMLDLVNDLLDLSRFESGNIQLTKEPSEMDLVLVNTCQRMQPLARKKDLTLECTPEQGLPKISMDARRIDQVIMNLLTNAVKFTKDGGKITVLSKETELIDDLRQGRRGVSVSVSDTGDGISPDELSLVFDKYKQTKTGRLSQHKGTGLGLAICKSIIEAHGGKIWVESIVGQGTTFTFVIPIGE